LVPPGDPEVIAQAAIKILKDPEWAKQLGRAAQMAVLDHHSADSMVRRLESIYKDLLQEEVRTSGQLSLN
jgi:glycosyltransferase involved in cell wall biosynthesis